MIQKVEQAMRAIEILSATLSHPIKREDYIIEDLGCPHMPTKLKAEYGGVYLFFYGGQALKIGKANKKCGPRFTYQHYGFSAHSTLAKSICCDNEFIQLGINKDNVKQWLLQNTYRINIQVKGVDTEATTELIEAVLHFQLRPRYEGALHRK